MQVSYRGLLLYIGNCSADLFTSRVMAHRVTCLGLLVDFFFDRIEGKVEEHSGVYECIYETNPVAKGNVSIEGNVVSLLLWLRRGVGKLCSPEHLPFGSFSAS